MEKEMKQIKKEIGIPLDVLMDVLKIILKTGFKHELTGIQENRGIVEISLFYDSSLKFNEAAFANIKQIIDDYKHLRFSEEADNHWKEI
jgi:hypothetical protein